MSASFRCSTDIKTFKDFKQNVTYFGESRIGWHDEPLLFSIKRLSCVTFCPFLIVDTVSMSKDLPKNEIFAYE